MQRPIAEPMMPASASGVSTQRPSKRSQSPEVTRKTPPARPTSSPMTSTRGSRSSSTWRASLSASASVRSAKRPPEHAAQLGEVARERRRRLGVRPLEDERRIGVGERLGFGDPAPHDLGGLGLDLRRQLAREDAETAQVGVVAANALPLALLLDPLG